MKARTIKCTSLIELHTQQKYYNLLKLYRKAHINDRKRLKVLGMFKLMFNWKSRIVIRKSIKRLVLRHLKRYAKREAKLRRRIRHVTISRGESVVNFIVIILLLSL